MKDEDLSAHFHWITPTLAVGDFYAATPPDCWNHFEAILNLSESEHPATKATKKASDHYLWLPFVDGDAVGFADNLEEALDFLHDCDDKTRLVHCAAGVSRSVSTALAYLCERQDTTTTQELLEAYRFLESARPIVYPCQEFIEVVAKRFGITAPNVGW